MSSNAASDPTDGAEIVSHFSRLREAVPLIRHHHERWDGKGYPDRLAGTAIQADVPESFDIAATG